VMETNPIIELMCFYSQT